MRKGNMTILASILAISLVSVVFGAATLAYFTDVETAEIGQVTAGTLDMLISDSHGGTYGNDAIDLGGISGLGPGEQVIFTAWLRNDGNLDADYVFLRFCKLTEDEYGFAKQLKIVNIDAWSVAAGGWEFAEDPLDPYANGWLAYWYGDDTDTKGYLTLYDMVHVANVGGDSQKTGMYFANPIGSGEPQLPADGGKCGIRVTLELLWETKNKYQGASASFSIDFVASQDMVDLDDYITESMGPLHG